MQGVSCRSSTSRHCRWPVPDCFATSAVQLMPCCVFLEVCKQLCRQANMPFTEHLQCICNRRLHGTDPGSMSDHGHLMTATLQATILEQRRHHFPSKCFSSTKSGKHINAVNTLILQLFLAHTLSTCTSGSEWMCHGRLPFYCT